jgi:FAD-linked sulfhydryl oxidase
MAHECDNPPFKNMQSEDTKIAIRKKESGSAPYFLSDYFIIEPPTLCPPDHEEIRSSAWTLLHTIAAHYPDKPTVKEMSSAKHFITSFASLYPCIESCEMKASIGMKSAPPAIWSHKALSVWMCERHNAVNVKLGKTKDLFKCDVTKLDERWKKKVEE